MEDYPRDLEKELTKYSVPNPFNQARSWQLLFVSDDGKTVAVKRYKGLVLGTLALLIFFLVVACVFSYLYIMADSQNEKLTAELKNSSIALKKITAENDLLETKLWFIDEGNKKKKIEVAEVKEVHQPRNKKKKSEAPKVEKIRAKAEELSFTKIEGSPTTKIRFLIRNQSKLKRISGYVHVIMKPDLESQQGWLTLPPVVLKGGIPAVASKGRYFSINNFKSMHFKYNDKNLVQVYNNVTIFIYSKAGDKVFDSTYPVEIKIVKKKEGKVKKIVKKQPVAGKKATGGKKNKIATKDVALPVAAKKQGGTGSLARKGTTKTAGAGSGEKPKDKIAQEPQASGSGIAKTPDTVQPPEVKTEP